MRPRSRTTSTRRPTRSGGRRGRRTGPPTRSSPTRQWEGAAKRIRSAHRRSPRLRRVLAVERQQGRMAALHGDVPHVLEGNERVSAANVVIQVVTVTDSDFLDSPATLAGGRASPARQSAPRWTVIRGRWERESLKDVTTFVSKDGSEIELAPGRTGRAAPELGRGRAHPALIGPSRGRPDRTGQVRRHTSGRRNPHPARRRDSRGPRDRHLPRKSGLAEMLKGGVIMDVTNADQAKIAEDAGACAVMALERVPADIRAEGGVARMADATKVEEIERGLGPGDGEGSASGISSRRRSSRPSGSTTSTSRRSSRRPTRTPHRQVGLHRPVRVRRSEPRRGAATGRRRRRDDPHQGRGRDGQRSRPSATSGHAPRSDGCRACVPNSSWRPPSLRASGPGPHGLRDGQDAAVNFAAGGPGHAGGRGAPDAARRRRRVRRLGHLQVRGPGAEGA